MAQIYLAQGARCQEHPHRPAAQRCDRCALTFCAECLTPSPRLPDGTRRWYCAACTHLVAAATAREASARAWRTRATRAAAAARLVLLTLAGALLVAVPAGAAIRLVPHGEPRVAPGLDARCGELSRIRSVGAIGTQAPEDAVNVLTYPQRAQVLVLDPATGPGGAPGVSLPVPGGASGAGPAGAAGPPDAGGQDGAGGPAALVDECAAGWRPAGPLTLPAALVLDTNKEGAYVQRFALWQDPGAPRGQWVLDFELLASPSAAGDDFVPVPLDRPARLRETVEPQWFEVMRPGPGALAKPFPEAVPVRRLLLRVLSTHGQPQPRGRVEAVALGEVAAYGPDLEMVIAHPTGMMGEDTNRFVFAPADVRALAVQPKFVLFVNRTRVYTHTVVSVGQARNFEVTVEPGRAQAVQFVAGRPGRYEFYCRVPGHDRRGLIGSIIVR